MTDGFWARQVVHIVGCGLIGTSLGLALSQRGVRVTLEDRDPATVSLAVTCGAGVIRTEHSPVPTLVVVCVPPDHTAAVVAAQLQRWRDAVVTDVASVKLRPLRELQLLGVPLAHYVGSHPMAGRERGGTISARSDLFLGRTWVVCPQEQGTPEASELVVALANLLGCGIHQLSAAEHDEAVAYNSHTPQLVASLLAAQLRHAPDAAIALAGPGLRDTTRIAASDPELWGQILAHNASQVRAVLAGLSADLQRVLAALDAQAAEEDAPGVRAQGLSAAIAAGNAGVSRLPGKHGLVRRYDTITVLVDDKPGTLGKLFTELGELGINTEDVRLEHSPGAQVGFAELSVLPDATGKAIDDLQTRGWKVVEL